MLALSSPEIAQRFGAVVRPLFARASISARESRSLAALRRLARQGLFAEPTSASAAAALDQLSDAGSIKANETTVVLLTGNGLKAASTVADLVQ